MTTLTAHAYATKADLSDQADALDHAEAPHLVNDTPHDDCAADHARAIRQLTDKLARTADTDACRAIAAEIRRHALAVEVHARHAHNLNASGLTLSEQVTVWLREHSTRARGLELNGGRRGWSVKRRARELREPLRVLCDPDATVLETELAASLIARAFDQLSRDELLDPQVLRELGRVKGAKLIELAAVSGKECAAPASDGNGAEDHGVRRVSKR